MNALQPSPRLLRRIAAAASTTTDSRVLAWIAALHTIPAPRRGNLFHRTSVVKTHRNHRLCGFEVWRHFAGDVKRRKARLWFGCSRNGGPKQALQLAYKAAAMLSRMSEPELREWWEEYQAARAAHRPVSNLWRAEERFTDALDYSDRQQLCHLFQPA